MKDLTIQYAGQTITYSEILCTGFRISDRYSELAASAASEYMGRYYEAYGNFQSFAERGFQDGYKLLGEYLDDTIKDLVSRGIYDTNRTRILNEYGTALFGGWMDLEGCQGNDRQRTVRPRDNGLEEQYIGTSACLCEEVRLSARQQDCRCRAESNKGEDRPHLSD